MHDGTLLLKYCMLSLNFIYRVCFEPEIVNLQHCTMQYRAGVDPGGLRYIQALPDITDEVSLCMSNVLRRVVYFNVLPDKMKHSLSQS